MEQAEQEIPTRGLDFGTPQLSLDPGVQQQINQLPAPTGEVPSISRLESNPLLGKPDPSAYGDVFSGYVDPKPHGGHGACHGGLEAEAPTIGGSTTVGVGGECKVGGAEVKGIAGVGLTDSSKKGAADPEGSVGGQITVPVGKTGFRVGGFGEVSVGRGEEGGARVGGAGGLVITR